MAKQGIATRLQPKPRPLDTIRVHVGLEAMRGNRCWTTEIIVGDNQFKFHTPAAIAENNVPDIERLVAACMRDKKLQNNTLIECLASLGERLADVLLRHDTPQRAWRERQEATEALADAGGVVIYKLGVPVPIELLTFDAPVGGIGRFARMLGGRRKAWSQNGRRPGRVLGSGAILFHDDLVLSCDEGHINNALDAAFPNGVEPHSMLTKSKPGEAKAEINRLFQASTATWVHFQCHAVEGRFPRALRLTNDYEATQSSFTEPSRRIAAIMLNTCCSTRIAASLDTTGKVLEGSWAEYFTGDCGVPAVIGPFCPVLDERTMPFTKRFYDRLSREPRVFQVFADTRAELLEQEDATAFAYRYIGPSELLLPEQARIPSRPSKFRKVA